MVLIIGGIISALIFEYSVAFNESTDVPAKVEEWQRFPPLRHIDPFSQCVGDKGGAFCTSDIEFVAQDTNELYNAMRNYSKPPMRNDQMKAIYGYCLTRRCTEFLPGSSASQTALEAALGACLNSTLQREYGLRARIERAACYRHGESDRRTVSILDQAAAALFLMLVCLMTASTVYDLFVTNKDPKGYLMCFSLPANWAKLVAPWPKDKAIARLIGINGFRLLRLETIYADKSFKYLYYRSHNNIPSFAIGMILGILLYDWQKKTIDFSKSMIYTLLYWLLFPVLLLISWWPSIVFWGYGDMHIRLLIALLRNPAWALTISFLTLGMIYQIEKVAVYRRVLEWPGWVPMARVAFCCYNVNPIIIRLLTGSSFTFFTGSAIHASTMSIGVMGMSFVVGAVLWLAVEAPCANIVAKLFPEKRSSLRVYSPDKTD